MTQVWNIFRKDARHHWPEIAASVAVLVAFAWFDIRSWTHRNTLASAFSFLFVSKLSGFVNFLVPISWIFLIVRAVQGESLVGDRQFWVTRPYDWRQLVAAKALFVIAFVNFPFFCMDVFLLHRAGFHPSHHVVGLLWLQSQWILLLFFAIPALATVTKNIPQMLLATLLVALFMIGMVALSQVIPSSDFSSGTDWWTGFLFIATAVVIIFVQYSRRRTGFSRWLVAAACASFALILIAMPYRSLIARAYPLSREDLPVEFALLPADTKKGPSSHIYDGKVPVKLPLSLSGLSKEDMFLQLNGMIVTLDSSAGGRWDSGWQGQSLFLFPGVKKAQLSFGITQDVFDKFRPNPVSIHLLLGFTVYHDQNQRPFVMPVGEFLLPEIGLCSSATDYWRGMRCRVPLHRPAFLLATSEMAASTCPLLKNETTAPPGIFARGSVQYGDSDPAEMGISPVHEFSIYLSDWEMPDSDRFNTGICPGTPLILSNPQAVARHGIELQFDNLKLDDYRESSDLGRIMVGD